METKENEVVNVEKLAVSITDGNMGAEELLSTLKSLYEGFF
jgi:hypothetical protein